MKNITASLLILLSIGFKAYGQKDTLKLNAEIGLSGMWEVGTLNQLLLSPLGRLELSNNHINMEIETRYEFLMFNAFTVKNDLWNIVYFQYNPNKRLYPFLSGLTGFSESYRIDHSTQIATGLGVNLIERKPNRYLQANIGLGFFDLKYAHETAHNAISIAPLIKMQIPFLKNRFAVSTVFKGYLSLVDPNYLGLYNQLVFQMSISKKFSVYLNHTTIYNKVTPADIASTNSKLLFGLKYAIDK